MIDVALTLLPHTLPYETVSILDKKSIDYIKNKITSDFPHDTEAIKALEGYITRRRAHEAYDDLYPHLADMNELEAQTFIAMLNRALIEGHLFDAPSDDEIEDNDDSGVH
jgi:hypothetical protein